MTLDFGYLIHCDAKKAIKTDFPPPVLPMMKVCPTSSSPPLRFKK